MLPDIFKNRGLDIIRKLQDEGFSAYFVGGCVRDHLLGRIPKDFDIATDARPERIADIFSNEKAQVKLVGAHFGVVMVDGYEVATFRSDGSYNDGRRPESVTYEWTAEADALRRDFTINALYMNEHGYITDPVGGQKDLQAKVIRAIGNPADRFKEDHLRILRAIRFSCRYNFTIESKTETAMAHHGPDLVKIAKERISDELRRILTGPNVLKGISMMKYLYLLPYIFEITPNNFEHSESFDKKLKMIRLLEESDASFLPLILAILFHDQFHKNVTTQLSALKFSGGEIRDTMELVKTQSQIFEFPNFRVASRKRILRHPLIHKMLELHRVRMTIQTGYEGNVRWIKKKMEEYGDSINVQPLLNGDDLIEMGYKPSVDFKVVLDALENAQLEGDVETREWAHDFVIRKFEELGVLQPWRISNQF